MKTIIFQGDGESLPETPPNEESFSASNKDSKTTQESSVSHESVNPFFINIQLDIVAVMLLVVGTFTRMFRLESPNNVVFDEMHYGKYASLYLKNTFFFDSN